MGRRAVQLHPITVAAAVTSGAVLGGIPGAFLAVPLVAVLVAGTARIRLVGYLFYILGIY
jgi:predicted PurR-regulated permease PerM